MTISQTPITSGNEMYLSDNSYEENIDIDFVYNSAFEYNEPYMQISKLQAKTMQSFIRMQHINCILEIGTFVGYSTLSFLKVLLDNGTINTIEIDEEFYKQAVTNFEKYNFVCTPKAKVNALLGDAKPILKNDITLVHNADMIFLDGDKLNYLHYIELFSKEMRDGSYLVIDNALFKGKVVTDIQNEYATAIDKAIKYLKSCECFQYFFVPVGDCMIIARKISL